ncbi:tRNA-dihydrouridine(20/20a) synthase [Nymphaea thermarum]|nr:tRNA-dihydrouridine(20/20a) synthase [Nymphaea thermarum]
MDGRRTVDLAEMNGAMRRCETEVREQVSIRVRISDGSSALIGFGLEPGLVIGQPRSSSSLAISPEASSLSSSFSLPVPLVRVLPINFMVHKDSSIPFLELGATLQPAHSTMHIESTSRVPRLLDVLVHGYRSNLKNQRLQPYIILYRPIVRNIRFICHGIDSPNAGTNSCQQYLPPWFSVAPMMDWTDNHYRTLARLISKHAWLYTEMVVAETIVHQQENLDRFLAFPPEQHPIVLQIGGSNLENLAKATELANSYNYDEINLNCGCPSGKVAGHGCFGAQLMFRPKFMLLLLYRLTYMPCCLQGKFVGEAMAAIASNSSVPVSVKCRIGVDDRDTYDQLCEFVDTVSSRSPTRHFIIHARKALLKGLNPAENRRIPPLNLASISSNLVLAARSQGAHGVMVGRAAYRNPWSMLGHVDSTIYGLPPSTISRRQIIEKFQGYSDSVIGKYGPNRPSLRLVVKPLLNIFHSEPGNSLWKCKVDAAMRQCKVCHKK